MSASKREEILSNMLFSSIENGDNDISKAAISLGVQGHKRHTKFIKETLVKLNKEIFEILIKEGSSFDDSLLDAHMLYDNYAPIKQTQREMLSVLLQHLKPSEFKARERHKANHYLVSAVEKNRTDLLALFEGQRPLSSILKSDKVNLFLGFLDKLQCGRDALTYILSQCEVDYDNENIINNLIRLGMTDYLKENDYLPKGSLVITKVKDIASLREIHAHVETIEIPYEALSSNRDWLQGESPDDVGFLMDLLLSKKNMQSERFWLSILNSINVLLKNNRLDSAIVMFDRFNEVEPEEATYIYMTLLKEGRTLSGGDWDKCFRQLNRYILKTGGFIERLLKNNSKERVIDNLRLCAQKEILLDSLPLLKPTPEEFTSVMLLKDSFETVGSINELEKDIFLFIANNHWIIIEAIPSYFSEDEAKTIRDNLRVYFEGKMFFGEQPINYRKPSGNAELRIKWAKSFLNLYFCDRDTLEAKLSRTTSSKVALYLGKILNLTPLELLQSGIKLNKTVKADIIKELL